jgi:hypothetical protein
VSKTNNSNYNSCVIIVVWSTARKRAAAGVFTQLKWIMYLHFVELLLRVIESKKLKNLFIRASTPAPVRHFELRTTLNEH